VSDFLLHLHMEKHLAILTPAGYQMAITSPLRATFGMEVGWNQQGQHQHFSVESCLGFVSIDKTTFRTAGPSVRSAVYMEDSFPHRVCFLQMSGWNPCFRTYPTKTGWTQVTLPVGLSFISRHKCWARARSACLHALFQHLAVTWAMAWLKTASCVKYGH